MSLARIATTDDLVVLAALIEQATQATRSFRGGLLLAHEHRSVEPSQRVRKALKDSSSIAFCGEFDGHVFGVCLAHLETSSEGALSTIDELWVEPGAREMGIGEKLIEACIEWSIKIGAVGIEIDVLPGDRNMKNLCERTGLTARMLTMHRPLKP